MRLLNLIVLVALALLVILFGWLTRHAWRIRRAILKWVSVIFAGLATLALLLLLVLGMIGYAKLYLPQNYPVAGFQVAKTPEQIARGEKLAHICETCHSSTGQFPLDGGARNFVGALGSFYAPNLTPGGPLKDWSDGEIIRAIREGVAANGRALYIMPVENFHFLSDADAQSIVAFLRSQTAVDHNAPANEFGPIGMFLVGGSVFPNSAQPPITQPIIAPPMSAPMDYGNYLVEISACRSCHGADLAGGTSPYTPIGPNLTAFVPRWSQADFIKTIQTGVDPTGHELKPDQMPWKLYANMYSVDELKTIYAYLHSLPLIDKSAK